LLGRLLFDIFKAEELAALEIGIFLLFLVVQIDLPMLSLRAVLVFYIMASSCVEAPHAFETDEISCKIRS